MSSSYFLKNLPSRDVLEAMRADFPMIDVDAVEAFMVLSRVSGDILDALDRQLARAGASQAKLCVLGQLFRQPGASSAPCRLADALGVRRPTITGLLDRLEREGLVERVRSSGGDRRSLQARLTERGRRLVRRVMPERLRSVSALMGRLSARERKSLLALLGKVGQGVPALERR